MILVLVLGRLLLAAVFALAALTKLASRAVSVKAIESFGAPARVAPALAWVLPLAELTVVLLLLLPVPPVWGAAGALGLLAAFSVAIAADLLRGRKPDCHCFGQLHSAPGGWHTLLRNLAFWSAAGFMMWQGPMNTDQDKLRALDIAWVELAPIRPLLAIFG